LIFINQSIFTSIDIVHQYWDGDTFGTKVNSNNSLSCEICYVVINIYANYI